MWKKLPEDVKNQIMTEGFAEISWGKEKYPISKVLIEDGRENLLLQGGSGLCISEVSLLRIKLLIYIIGSIPVVCPVRLIHGLSDEEV